MIQLLLIFACFCFPPPAAPPPLPATLRYLTTVAGQSNKKNTKTVADQIMDSNPVLEAFGNAKTLRNNNSSRFGKWMEVNFNGNKICGCRIVNYLLEKSRVVQQTQMERNYHVFYMLLAGDLNPELKSKLKLSNADSFNYLKKSGCTTVMEWDDKEEFSIMEAAMKTLNFSRGEMDDIYTVLATILHLGNIEFDGGDDNSSVSKSTEPHLEKMASVMKANSRDIETALTSKMMKMGGARGRWVSEASEP